MKLKKKDLMIFNDRVYNGLLKLFLGGRMWITS